MIFVDHLTRGRAMYGLGVGVLPVDAGMIGLDPGQLRPAFEDSVDALIHLIRKDDPYTAYTEHFHLVDARVQMHPFSDFEILIAAVVSPSGARITGKHGLPLISVGATMSGGMDALASHWEIVERRSREFGVDPAGRDAWRMVGLMHLAETREQAVEDVHFGIDHYFDYLQQVSATPQFSPAGETTEERIAWVVDNGIGVIGTPTTRSLRSRP
jgi:limonene 1,2-monooxygenase